jgi:hypothetical protein
MVLHALLPKVLALVPAFEEELHHVAVRTLALQINLKNRVVKTYIHTTHGLSSLTVAETSPIFLRDTYILPK